MFGKGLLRPAAIGEAGQRVFHRQFGQPGVAPFQSRRAAARFQRQQQIAPFEPVDAVRDDRRGCGGDDGDRREGARLHDIVLAHVEKAADRQHIEQDEGDQRWPAERQHRQRQRQQGHHTQRQQRIAGRGDEQAGERHAQPECDQRQRDHHLLQPHQPPRQQQGNPAQWKDQAEPHGRHLSQVLRRHQQVRRQRQHGHHHDHHQQEPPFAVMRVGQGIFQRSAQAIVPRRRWVVAGKRGMRCLAKVEIVRPVHC